MLSTRRNLYQEWVVKKRERIMKAHIGYIYLALALSCYLHAADMQVEDTPTACLETSTQNNGSVPTTTFDALKIAYIDDVEAAGSHTAELELENKHLTERLNASAADLCHLQTKYSDANQKLREATNIVLEQERRLDTFKCMATDYGQELTQVREHYMTTSEQLTSAHEQMNNLQDQLTATIYENDCLAQQLACRGNISNEELTTLRSKNSELNDVVAVTNQDLAQTQHLLACTQEQVHELATKLIGRSITGIELRELEENCTLAPYLSTAFASLKQQAAYEATMNAAVIENLKQELDQAHEATHNKTNELALHVATIETLKHALNQAHETTRHCAYERDMRPAITHAHLANLQKNSHDLANNNAQLTQQLQQAHQTHEALSLQLAQVHQALTDRGDISVADLRALRDDNAQLASRLSITTADLWQLNTKVAALERDTMRITHERDARPATTLQAFAQLNDAMDALQNDNNQLLQRLADMKDHASHVEHQALQFEQRAMQAETIVAQRGDISIDDLDLLRDEHTKLAVRLNLATADIQQLTTKVTSLEQEKTMVMGAFTKLELEKTIAIDALAKLTEQAQTSVQTSIEIPEKVEVVSTPVPSKRKAKPYRYGNYVFGEK